MNELTTDEYITTKKKPKQNNKTYMGKEGDGEERMVIPADRKCHTPRGLTGQGERLHSARKQ